MLARFFFMTATEFRFGRGVAAGNHAAAAASSWRKAKLAPLASDAQAEAMEHAVYEQGSKP
ncbi:hypothetical protein AIOL_001115 [Candidatus Rhodobacter oscarellae]|uniref:Uncharacterized protein n=1 Tax=Candidatus Rhodobacter oscarellae TaxID=1675527 RepID=A0A0J9GRR3_9RHOB|nr:hypothetical protein [Candidatus Rhodobacter lobularis]KMW56163.1 hypothetical protein AIOL_001115 [Candidatus Rhodobacter lobularis]